MREFDFLGVGWCYPVETDVASGQIKMSAYEKDVSEAVRIILRTTRGERIMRPEFGSSLHSFAFVGVSLSSLSRMADEVRNSLVLWEPRIRDVEVEVIPDGERARVDINIAYSIRLTNNRYNLVFPYYIDEGSRV